MSDVSRCPSEPLGCLAEPVHSMVSALENGTCWTDDCGRAVQAHGGWVLPVVDGLGGTCFYWYGEDKSAPTRGQRADAIGIRCYASTDLLNWHDCGLVFKADSRAVHDVLRPEGVMERPRVLYCKQTGKYVLWFHADDATYRAAMLGMAVSDAPTGPFTFVRLVRPSGQDSRAFTLYVDDRDHAYLFSSSEGNRTLHIARLADDYADVKEGYVRALPEQMREAPCVFAAHGQYYLLTSGCSGWRANAALFATAPQVAGPWKLLDNPCRGPHEHASFGGQPTCVFGTRGRLFALFDHWHANDLGASGYSILPVSFAPVKHDPLEIHWTDTFCGLDEEAGREPAPLQ